MSYLINRYKGTYRLLAPLTQDNQFQRKLDGTFEDSDVYIDCQRGIQVFHYGKNILEAYVPSLQTGHNIIKQLYATYINPKNVTVEQKDFDNAKGSSTKTTYTVLDTDLVDKELKALTSKDIIFHIVESDSEVIFRFIANNDEKILPLLKPKTSGANRSPFSSKNLQYIKYEIPEEDLALYKEITAGMSISDGSGLRLNKLNKEFLQSLTNKRYTLDKLNEDMAKAMLKGKEYIHSIGKWNEYISFLKKNW